MNANTKSIIRGEIANQIFGTYQNNSHENNSNIDAEIPTDKAQSILMSLQQNLSELSLLESRLNFMVREVRSSLRNK